MAINIKNLFFNSAEPTLPSGPTPKSTMVSILVFPVKERKSHVHVEDSNQGALEVASPRM